MEFNKTQKVILGIFTLLPFLFVPYLILEIFQFVIHVIAASNTSEPDVADILTAVLSFILPIILVSLLSIALLILYIVHAASNKQLESVEKIMWILLFFFFGIVAFPIYWLMRIWNT